MRVGGYAWAMTATYLDGIMAFHRERTSRDPRVWQNRVPEISERPSLRERLVAHRPCGMNVIAEIKRRSPSKGWLAENLDAGSTAALYEAGGATGISVLTDAEHFGGSLDDLRTAGAHTTLPLLRKDFTVGENDVLDALEAGASAVLLIAAALTHEELDRLLRFSSAVGLDALVEVHSAEEIARALDVGAQLLGINQRDLHTFAVDTAHAEELVELIPPEVVAVAESGFSEIGAVRRAGEVGFDAVLVGECFVRASDPRAAVRSFVGAPIGSRT